LTRGLSIFGSMLLMLISVNAVSYQGIALEVAIADKGLALYNQGKYDEAIRLMMRPSDLILKMPRHGSVKARLSIAWASMMRPSGLMTKPSDLILKMPRHGAIKAWLSKAWAGTMKP